MVSLSLNSQELLGEGECEPALGHELLHGDVAAQPGVEAEGSQHAVGEDGRQRLRRPIICDVHTWGGVEKRPNFAKTVLIGCVKCGQEGGRGKKIPKYCEPHI